MEFWHFLSEYWTSYGLPFFVGFIVVKRTFWETVGFSHKQPIRFTMQTSKKILNSMNTMIWHRKRHWTRFGTLKRFWFEDTMTSSFSDWQSFFEFDVTPRCLLSYFFSILNIILNYQSFKNNFKNLFNPFNRSAMIPYSTSPIKEK